MSKGIILCGPTASGKSSLAIKMAKEIDGEIINCDSRQIYKELPIISAQPSLEDLNTIPHHMYGIISIEDDYSVGHFLKDVEKAVRKVLARGKTPIIVGGTGMYVNALYNGIAEVPEVAKEYINQATEMLENLGREKFYAELTKLDNNLTFDQTNTQRMIRYMSVYLAHNKPLKSFYDNNYKVLTDLEWEPLLLSIPRDKVYENCNTRFMQMWEGGVLDEVKAIMESNIDQKHYTKSIGVQEVVDYLNGIITKEDAIALVQQKTRNYAKRQMTWFRNKSPFLKIYSILC
ncbi:MAG: tRNA (adenosine(37)-N6)-dimethylallyltransferase MiaA [Alphaproteobacteria bacterium]|nr:tRNA (adenosine(37)-N6)-dimethylallyltransferase MiaA [Alphaproteobacteria bacterium]OJV15728.1 MAG: tRNA (adenosine(37)-N6)-dimethylallyltransferase MiaA [Alphaproteobacteria bacterium 33-17]